MPAALRMPAGWQAACRTVADIGVANGKVAAVQMCSGDDVAANLATIDRLLGEAAAAGCSLAVLPENTAFVGKDDRAKLAVAEPPGDGPIQAFLGEAARRHRISIIAGSLPLIADTPARCYGAAVMFADDGTVAGTYRKIHLFDVDIREGGERYRESAYCQPGEDVVTVAHAVGIIGLTICYDLRFPELYRRLAREGATVFCVPAAFTEATGRAHWDVLLRARAIENLSWVVAAAQFGTHPNGRRTYGHSMIVDPWGRVVSALAEGEGIVVAELDQRQTARLRQEFPVLDHRRL
jgi:deaminated glutathione amidase